MPETADAREDINALKSGVVAITSWFNEKRRTGTGVVVSRDQKGLYILTATHVVEGDDAPLVEFLAQRHRRLTSEVLRMEGANPNGVAVLVVRTDLEELKAVRPLSFAPSKPVRDGEEVHVIGFPQGGHPWSVVKAVISGRDGRDLVLSGYLDEGSSGAPVLRDRKVIGMVTSAKGAFARAAPQELVAMVLENWGVDIQTEAAPATQVEGGRGDPGTSPNRLAGASVEKVRCSAIDKHLYRIDVSGTVNGPEGSYFHVELDGSTTTLQRAELECDAWTRIATKPPQCQRQPTDAGRTSWHVSYVVRGTEGPPNEVLGHLLVSQSSGARAPEGPLRVSLRCE